MPPVKPAPCARLESWLDPATQPAQKGLDAIGKALQAQYQTLDARARYRLCLDPTLDDVRKLCIGLRRSHSGRGERLLFQHRDPSTGAHADLNTLLRVALEA